jgi:hypothetical protein
MDGYIVELAQALEPLDVGLRIDQPFTPSGDKDDIAYDMALTGTAQSYYVGPPPTDENWHIVRLLATMIDNTFTDAADYGAINNGLPTGIDLHVVDGDDNILYDFTPVPIKRSHDWSLYAGPDAVTVGGAGADPLMVRWTFQKAGYPVLLEGARGMRLRLLKPDDLSSMVSHIVGVQGYKEKIPS